MKGIARPLVTLLMGWLLVVTGAQSAPRWDNPMPQGNIIADVAWNGAVFVAVGNAGTVLTSPDGLQWQPAASGTTAWLEAIRWNAALGQFIATGNEGILLTGSADGRTWTHRSSHTESHLYGVAHNDRLTVAVGSSGTVVTGNDGANWTSGSAGVIDWLNDVASNGREFIAVGSDGTIVASTDGLHWSRRDSPVRDAAGDGPSLEAVVWSAQADRWVAVSDRGPGPAGEMAYALWSADGVTWTAAGITADPLHTVAWDDARGRFVAAGDSGRVLIGTVGTDGITWGAPHDTGVGESLEVVIAGPNGVVAAGEHGVIISAADPLGAWTRLTGGTLETLAGIAGDGSGYVAVGEGVILHRGDISVTASEVIEQLQGSPLPFLRGVAWDVGGYVAVGDGGVILRSTDGVSWLPDVAPAAAGIGLTRVLRAGGSWFAIGAQGTILRDDGHGWTAVRSGSEALYGFAADSAGFIAVGQQGAGGVVLTSTDGNSWSTGATSGVPLHGVASNHSVRVAVGAGGTFLTWTGSGWTTGNVGNMSDLNDILWDGRRFVAVGDHGATFASGDGIHWSRQNLTGNTLYAIAPLTGGAFMVAGEGGTVIYTSCPCAANDQVVTKQGQSITIAVLANDSGENLTLRGVDGQTTHGGSVTQNSDGTVTYTPAGGFVGSDTFSYTLGSSADPAATDTATVTVSVDGRSGSLSHGTGGGGSAAALLLPLAWAAMRRRRYGASV